MRFGVCCAVFGLLFPILAAAAEEGRFMRTPDIHGSTVIFTYEGDLWSVPASGGTAVRLTSHPGVESHVKFSPDGTTIAFTASYDGGEAVYIMPASGGVPERLTFLPGGAQTVQYSAVYRPGRETHSAEIVPVDGRRDMPPFGGIVLQHRSDPMIT